MSVTMNGAIILAESCHSNGQIHLEIIVPVPKR